MLEKKDKGVRIFRVKREGLQKRTALFVLSLLICAICQAATLKGKIIDADTEEPLTGATVQIIGKEGGAVADIDGNFVLQNIKSGTYSIIVKYIGYVSQQIDGVKVGGKNNEPLVIRLKYNEQSIKEVNVTAKRNLESERALQVERMNSNIAIENIGSKEMSVKGLGDVQEGVKKLTGISIASAGQLIVRGLGDRYSITTLNGLPIASPNPDNKLVPLDLFPSSTVEAITVSKVYDATSFADYSGAHIDINTKDNVAEDFFQISVNGGGKFNTFGKDFYDMDNYGGLFKSSSYDKSVLSLEKTADFRSYVKEHNIFKTSFDVEKRTALPDFGGNIGFGKNVAIGNQTLSILGSVTYKNESQTINDAYYRDYNTQGNILNDFGYDSYTQSQEFAALGSLSYTLRESDRIGYTFFYARDISDTYMRREGEDSEDHQLVGSHNVTHIYSLQNHQIHGSHDFGTKWQFDWSGSYSTTGSQEPDRRQVMFEKNEDTTLSLFDLNAQETMRYFGELNEDEWNGSLGLKYNLSEKNNIKIGFNYKDKSRDYKAVRFYYNISGCNVSTGYDGIYSIDDYINQDYIADGTITITKRDQDSDSYTAGNKIYAGYAQTDYYPVKDLLINFGLRYEISKQWVNYFNQGGTPYRRDLNKNDLFPTINLKYSLDKEKNIRFSLSRTVTRPSFIEMAPFLYQESYGGAQIRGNADLENGYNYNADLRFELFKQNNDMFSITAYYKHLDKPIERTQTATGGGGTTVVHSFQNADQGSAYGIEVEARKEIIKDLRIGANISYMHTNVKLPEGGVYTNKERELQGASPILINADITYTPKLSEDRQLTLALLYNLQGSRIHAVGINQLGDIKQQSVNTLNFNASYDITKNFTVKLLMKDLLNQDVVFKQEIPTLNKSVTVEKYKRGTAFEIGLTYKL